MRVQHPSFPHVFQTIPDDRLADWLAAGWLSDEPAVGESAEDQIVYPPIPVVTLPKKRADDK